MTIAKDPKVTFPIQQRQSDNAAVPGPTPIERLDGTQLAILDRINLLLRSTAPGAFSVAVLNLAKAHAELEFVRRERIRSQR